MSYNGNELANKETISNDKDDVKDNFDVVFMVDEINYTDEELSAICEKIYNTSMALKHCSAKETFEYEHKNGYLYVYQKPIYFMQILAGVSANEEYYNLADFILGFYYAEKYQLAAGGMIEMNFAGIKNPHFIDAYIILCEV